MPPTIANERKRLRRKPERPRPGVAFYAPDCVQGILELTEDAACAEECQRNPDGCGNCAFPRLRRRLGNLLYSLYRTLIEKVAHLQREFAPSACWIVAKNHADNREQH